MKKKELLHRIQQLEETVETLKKLAVLFSADIDRLNVTEGLTNRLWEAARERDKVEAADATAYKTHLDRIDIA